MKQYSEILSRFYSSPWLLTKEKYWEIEEFLRAKANGGMMSEEHVAAVAATRRQSSGAQMAGKVAVVPIFGVISQRVGMLEEASGGVSAEALGVTLDKLVADKAVKSIALVFDSPGGSVYGIRELGDKIRGYRGQKKVVGIADSVAASAAYWLLSQCQEVNVTPGGMVGGIGVILGHVDLSKREEMKGRKTTLITAGKYKAEGFPFDPLGEDARGEMQSKVDAYYDMFVNAVAKGRGVTEGKVRNDFGQGRMVMARDAITRGMADHIGTLEQVLRRLGGAGGDGVPEAILPFGTAAVVASRLREIEMIEAGEGLREVGERLRHLERCERLHHPQR